MGEKVEGENGREFKGIDTSTCGSMSGKKGMEQIGMEQKV